MTRHDSPSWSYYGAAHRYDVHEDPQAEAACRQHMDRLVLEGREEELRALADGGDRCAFVALIEVLVDADRTADLRAMAQTGDARAHATFIELLRDRGREEGLRQEAAAGDGLALHALVDLLLTQGRTSDALAQLQARTEPKLERQVRALRVRVLLDIGDAEPVRRLADAGDRAAARSLVAWLFERGDVEALGERARAGDDQALWRHAQLLAEANHFGDAIAALRLRVEQGHPFALQLTHRFLAEKTDTPLR